MTNGWLNLHRKHQLILNLRELGGLPKQVQRENETVIKDHLLSTGKGCGISTAIFVEAHVFIMPSQLR